MKKKFMIGFKYLGMDYLAKVSVHPTSAATFYKVNFGDEVLQNAFGTYRCFVQEGPELKAIQCSKVPSPELEALIIGEIKLYY